MSEIKFNLIIGVIVLNSRQAQQAMNYLSSIIRREKGHDFNYYRYGSVPFAVEFFDFNNERQYIKYVPLLSKEHLRGMHLDQLIILDDRRNTVYSERGELIEEAVRCVQMRSHEIYGVPEDFQIVRLEW